MAALAPMVDRRRCRMDERCLRARR